MTGLENKFVIYFMRKTHLCQLFSEHVFIFWLFLTDNERKNHTAVHFSINLPLFLPSPLLKLKTVQILLF